MILDSTTRKFDEFASNVMETHPNFELQDPVEAEIPDEISSVSTCATPTNPIDILSLRSSVISSNKNFPCEFFNAELDGFEMFLSTHENVVAEKIRSAATPGEYDIAEDQLLVCQV